MITDLQRGFYRRIYAGFITGKRINSVSQEAEAWFWRINAVVDDFGNMHGDPVLVHSATTGRRRVKVEQVERWLVELEKCDDPGLIRFYEVSGERYLHVTGFMGIQPCGKNGKRVRRFPPCPFEIEDCKDGQNEVNPRESRSVHPNPSDSSATHDNTHHKPPPTSSVPPKVEIQNPKSEIRNEDGGGGDCVVGEKQRVIVKLLRGIGISNGSLDGLCAMPELNPCLVQQVIDHVQGRKNKADSPAGLVTYMLKQKDFSTLPRLSQEQVCRWINAGLVSEVCGISCQSAKQNGQGVHLVKEDGKMVVIPPAKLVPERIVFV